MKIQRVSFSNPSFGSNRKKFDVQGHIGTMYDNGQKVTYNSQNIIDTVEPNNVKKVLVSSLSGLNSLGQDTFCSESDSAKEITAMKGNDNVKLLPLLSCQPGIAKSIWYKIIGCLGCCSASFIISAGSDFPSVTEWKTQGNPFFSANEIYFE